MATVVVQQNNASMSRITVPGTAQAVADAVKTATAADGWVTGSTGIPGGGEQAVLVRASQVVLVLA
jgi:hypothetical protein